ncbi:hypothetical protein [Streptomyces ipomoeae]|uniref:hypothetical protein n=1 Tax=Streptomyces ipomoeae TaxID=103232 RepID=UPI001FD00DD1|nr:hypothetical protein [Streptomyces ipomoeae]MDX2938605.1 hypothetical protein [Streptomyces ipomoeae]
MQIQVEPATREVAGQQVRAVDGQRGLAHPAHAVDRHHRRVPRGAEESVQLLPAPGEGGDVVWQIVANRRGAAVLVWGSLLARSHTSRIGLGSRPAAPHSTTTAGQGGTAWPEKYRDSEELLTSMSRAGSRRLRPVRSRSCRSRPANSSRTFAGPLQLHALILDGVKQGVVGDPVSCWTPASSGSTTIILFTSA